LAYIVSIVYTPENIKQRPADHFGRVAVDRAALVADKLTIEQGGGSGS
jgi:hypothetical protein